MPVHVPRVEMRRLPLIALLALAACTEATASRIDERTFSIEGPGLPSLSDAPNRRIALQLCPGGYRVIDQSSHNGTPDRYRDEPGFFTNWTIRCL